MKTDFTLPQNLPIIDKTISQSMISAYSKISNDFNPIHLDSNFAINAGFDTTIAPAMTSEGALSPPIASTAIRYILSVVVNLFPYIILLWFIT